MTDRPILFLDVDGPLNPERINPSRRPEGFITIRTRPAGTMWEDTRRKPLPVWLNPSHGPALLKLPYELVWATTWEHEANVWIGPHIGLPEIPVVEFTGSGRSTRVHWKTRNLISYADGRPFVWVDDECSAADAEYLGKFYGPHGKTFPVSPLTGLTDHHFQRLADVF
jgi:hypothetical protein